MDPMTFLILVSGALVSLWLVFYVRFKMPGKLDDQFRESLKAFSTAIELRIPNHQGLTQRVVALSEAVGGALKMKPAEMRRLEMASMLRDIGLVAIPYEMMNGKLEAHWTEAERLTYERHAEISGAMLELVDTLRHVAPLVRWHHAPFGGGSLDPSVPQGKAIPIESRVLKVVSEYVWLERTRGDLLAREYMRDGSGSEYDPQVIGALMFVLTSARVPSAEALEVN